MGFKIRFGQFFLFIGLIMLVVFFATGQHPLYEAFCGGTVFTTLGIFLIWRSEKPPPAPSTRFNAVRKLRDRPSKKPKEAPKK